MSKYCHMVYARSESTLNRLLGTPKVLAGALVVGNCDFPNNTAYILAVSSCSTHTGRHAL